MIYRITREDLKNIVTTIREKAWWPFAKGFIKNIPTLGVAIGTILMAIYSSRNISLTTELADRTWRPEVYMELPVEGYKIDSIAEEKSPITHNLKLPLYRISNVIWTNTGGSPALEVRYNLQTTPLHDTLPDYDTLAILESPSSMTINGLAPVKLD